ncbi:MAG TPA: hypothetical protein PLC42_05430 [Parachlamydiaceae bacterium]|nr:hypothetical protein [Parachlamydiaceae bacterium]
MFDEEGFSLAPINFFQLSLDCKELEKPYPSLMKAKGDKYLLPATAALTDEENFATLFMGFSSNGIEVLVSIEKPIEKCFYPAITKGDSVELFFDTRNVKTSGFNTRFCHHFFFLPEAVEDHQLGEITKFRTEDAHELSSSSDLQLKVKSLPKGYSLEIFIPKQSLHGYDPEQFGQLGFTYRINRYHGEPQHFSALTAEYQIEQQPSLWSSLKLVKK